MILYYIRHGDPNYELDCLTKLGKKQAEALSNRLAKLHFDEIYVSPLGRAKETAQPTLDKLNMKATVLEYLSEAKAWEYFARVFEDNQMHWCYQYPPMARYLNSPRMVAMGNKWYEDDKVKPYGFEAGVLYFREHVRQFMKEQGYEWDEEANSYIEVTPNNKRIALFAHEGNSRAFITSLLNIPYPFIGLHYEFGHTGIIKIVIRPFGDDKHCIPVIYSSCSTEHLYSDDVEMYFDKSL